MQEYTEEEIAKHNTPEDCWLLIHGKIYDVTEFQNDHPGGADSLLDHGGKDATTEFEDIFHTVKARQDIAKFIVGKLKGYEGDDNAIMKSGGPVSASGASSLLIGIPIMVIMFAFLYQFVLNE